MIVLTTLVSLVTFQRPAQRDAEFRAVAVGNRFPGAGGGGNHCGEDLLARGAEWKAFVASCAYLAGDADECRLWCLPDGAARAESGLLAHGGERQGGRLRIEDWRRLVDL